MLLESAPSRTPLIWLAVSKKRKVLLSAALAGMSRQELPWRRAPVHIRACLVALMGAFKQTNIHSCGIEAFSAARKSVSFKRSEGCLQRSAAGQITIIPNPELSPV